MDTESLRAQLAEALASVQHPRSPLLLEPLLRNPDILQTMVSDLICRDILHQIAASYQAAEPRYRMLRLIQQGLSHYYKAQTRRRIGKSLHDIKGNFVWAQRKCGELFQRDTETLSLCNLFELMDVESQHKIYETYGRQLISAEDLSSVVIGYRVGGMRLVSRCTPVYYSTGSGDSRFGIFVETRKSRTICPFRSPISSLLSPSLPLHVFSTPSPIKQEDCKLEPFTTFSVSPLLSEQEDKPHADIREFS